ncbi:hypothetical protein KPL74_11760 [Bacillus sp. NP157]|nr:hypothetical protein KPL74_11760 [Bacillus sp. NP157]
MTKASRKFVLSLLLVVPAAAFAQAATQPAAAPRPAPVARPAAAPVPAARPRVVPGVPPPNARFQQQVNQQQLINRQNQNAVQEQLRQNNVNQQRNATTDPALRSQLDNADRAQQDQYRARQDNAAKRYQDQQTQPTHP